MFRITFNLGRPAHVAFDQHTGGDSRLKKGRRVEERPAGKNFLGRAHVGHDFFGGQLRARAQPGQGRGSSHQLQHIAAIDLVVAFSRYRRKFVIVKLLRLRSARKLFEALPETRRAGAGKLCARRSQVNRILRVEIFAHRLAFITGGTWNRSANSERDIRPSASSRASTVLRRMAARNTD